MDTVLGVIEFKTYGPPTNVMWMRDGEPVTVDGSGYEMILTVANRVGILTPLQYNNKLLIRNAVDLVGYHTYTCIVSNYAGNSSKTVDAVFLGK